MKPIPIYRAGWRQALAPVAQVWSQVFWLRHRGMLLLGLLLAAVTVLAGMALLGLSGWFISATAIAGLSTATALVFDVFMPSSGIRLFTLGRTLARYGERLATHEATLAVLAALRERLFRGWARPQAARALAQRPARLLFRLTADIDALDALYLRVLVPLGAALAAGVAAAVALGLVHGPLALAVLALLLGGGGVVLAVLLCRAQAPARLRAHAIDALRARTADLVAGQTDLLMAGRLPAQGAAVAHADAVAARCDDRLQRLDSGAGLALGALASSLLGLALWAVAQLVEQGAIGVPVAVLVLLVVLTVAEPLATLRRGALEMGRMALAARRVAPALQAQDTPPASMEAPPADMALVLQGARATYAGAARPCLQDVSLHLARGERVAIVGPSGAGKSSLMAVLTGELALQAGTVQALPYAWLTQRTELFQDTLGGNLRLARATASDDELWQALETAGLAATVRTWPQGLDTWLGEGGLGLSGGQARRLALARLLLRQADLWLLDEPTEGLDDETARDVLRRLGQALAGRSLLLVTHTQREAALAQRLLVLEQGRLVEQGQRGDATYARAWEALRLDLDQDRVNPRRKESSP